MLTVTARNRFKSQLFILNTQYPCYFKIYLYPSSSLRQKFNVHPELPCESWAMQLTQLCVQKLHVFLVSPCVAGLILATLDEEVPGFSASSRLWRTCWFVHNGRKGLCRLGAFYIFRFVCCTQLVPGSTWLQTLCLPASAVFIFDQIIVLTLFWTWHNLRKLETSYCKQICNVMKSSQLIWAIQEGNYIQNGHCNITILWW